MNSDFPKSKDDSLIKITLFWGVNSIDKSKVSRWDEVYVGEMVWDDSFDLASPSAQQLFITMCDDLKKLEGRVLNATPSGGGEVTCFMEGFRDWLVANGHSFPVASSSDFTTRLL